MSFFNDIVLIFHTSFQTKLIGFYLTLYKAFISKSKGLPTTGARSTRNLILTIIITLGFNRRHCPNFEAFDLKLVVSRYELCNIFCLINYTY